MNRILITLICFPASVLCQSIGDFYQGGVVFYLDNSGIIQKGLIVDTAYLDANYPWSLQDSLISDWGPNLHYCNGTENELIGGGKQNTDVFEIDHPAGNYAANLCSHSFSGGFSDWFLPSIDELWQLMLNVNTVDSAINIHGGDIIQANFHWSSTQVLVDSLGGDIRYAYSASPYSNMGPYIAIKSKNTAYLVRSIRCIDNDCSFLLPTVIEDFKKNKELIKVADVLGRETQRTNQLLFYIYDDGTVQKKVIID